MQQKSFRPYRKIVVPLHAKKKTNQQTLNRNHNETSPHHPPGIGHPPGRRLQAAYGSHRAHRHPPDRQPLPLRRCRRQRRHPRPCQPRGQSGAGGQHRHPMRVHAPVRGAAEALRRHPRPRVGDPGLPLQPVWPAGSRQQRGDPCLLHGHLQHHLPADGQDRRQRRLSHSPLRQPSTCG